MYHAPARRDREKAPLRSYSYSYSYSCSYSICVRIEHEHEHEYEHEYDQENQAPVTCRESPKSWRSIHASHRLGGLPASRRRASESAGIATAVLGSRR